ncbi:MAG: VWA domain-containing protein [Odoribacter sp.]|nr:VWA domain-containing protein [Odoribacter sp.]
MFDFAHPYLLNLLWLVPVFVVVFWWSRRVRRRRLARFGRADVIARLMPAVSPYKPAVKFVLRMVALAALIIVLARPRAGEQQHEEQIAGIEVMVAFDLSNSMNASATDDVNAASRLDRARLLLDKLIDRLQGNKVGMVVFAGTAKTQLPMTTDFGIARLYLSELNPDMMQYQGTSLAEAISMSANGFSTADDVHRAIILITDAEDHEGDAIEAAKAAAEKDIQLDVIGFGSGNGAPIPIAGRRGSYMEDSEGQTVKTALNSELAQQIADAGKGIFVNGAASDALDVLTKQLDKLQKSQFKNVKYSAGAEQFPVFAWIALVFLILDVFVLERKNNWLSKINFFSKK